MKANQTSINYPSNTKCWICGDDASTKEHKIKRTDLRDVFGTVTQQNPLYLHNNKRKNQSIGSLNAKILKSPSGLSAKCNNERTQPHDRAWEKLSSVLRAQNLTPGMNIRANKIFPYNTAKEMLNVHLYFIKLFGCHIIEGNIPIDVTSFGKSIMQEKAHPNIYLKFGINQSFTCITDIHTAEKISDGSCAFATWFYNVGNLSVNVMFAVEGEKRNGLVGAWHPKLGSHKIIQISKLIT